MQIGQRLSGWLSLAVFATVGGVVVAADPAFAKIDVDKLTIGGEIRARYEVRTNASFTQNVGGTQIKSNESLASERVRVNVGYDLTPDVAFFAQIQDARFWGSESCSNIGAGAGGVRTLAPGTCPATGIGAVSSANNNGTGVDLHQGYILVKNVLIPGLSLKIGRQEIIFGDHRLFGNFGWSQIGNSFDGVRLTHSMPVADLDLFWVRVADSAALGTSSNTGVAFPTGPGNPGGGAVPGSNGTNSQDVYGAYLTLKPIPNWTIEPYFFLLQDARDLGTVTVSDSDPNVFVGSGGAGFAATGNSLVQAQTQGQTRHTLGGRLNGKAGGLDLTAEGAWQFGSIASRCSRGIGGTCAAAGAEKFQGSRDLHINAHAEAAKIGYTFEPVPMKPRIGFEFDYASGDGDNNKANGADFGNYNTFDNLYPTNHFHYGYMDLMAWRNMVNYQVMFDVKPDTTSKFQVNFIWHRLADAQDNWYRAGQGAYAVSRPTNTTASLGRELDVHYWRTFKEKFKFEVGYGHFWAGSYIKQTLDPNHNSGPNAQGASTFNGSAVPSGVKGTVNDQNWGYLMASILF